ncbi:putative phosphoenolpyruvate phosphomutase [Lyophyllum shimeji]|uniref:Phosphoenolpyruvate phosphomutase n=1 Tax=Lyophyllum shimeji TaxID=47721 RepID=A0A9P3PV94_LYOSH|nr:putative phosphoenolpyruvate phosphomutase [Lyophyllum shimeji]
MYWQRAEFTSANFTTAPTRQLLAISHVPLEAFQSCALPGSEKPQGIYISHPVVFPNIYDPASTATVLYLNCDAQAPVEAVATASYAIAAGLDDADEDLTLEQNLDAIAKIAPLVRVAGLPLNADLQDGYGDRLVEVIQRAVALGVVPCTRNGMLADHVEEQVERIKLAKKTAADPGVKDFVINARTDVLALDLPPHGLVAANGARRDPEAREGVPRSRRELSLCGVKAREGRKWRC